MINQGLMLFVPGSGDYSLMFTYITDVVDAFRLSITNGTSGSTYNICPDKAATYREYIDVIATCFGRLRPFVHIPIPILKSVIKVIKPIMNTGKSRTFMYQEDTIARMEEGNTFVK